MSVIEAKQTQIATAINGNSVGTSLFARLSQAGAAKKQSAKATNEVLPPLVEQMIQKAKGLINDFSGWQIQFEAPSDRALWTLIGKVKGFRDEIKTMPEADQLKVKEAFRNEINSRTTKPTVNADTSLEALVVKYIFKDSPRQTVYNYRRAIEVADAAGVSAAGFASYVESKKGIIKMVEEAGTPEGVTSNSAQEMADRVDSMRQLMTTTAGEAQQIEFHGDLVECFTRPKESSDGKVEKPTDKKTPGNFVFLMGTVSDVEGKLNVLRGHIFDKSFEDVLLRQILSAPSLKDVDSTLLKAELAKLKQANDFNGMREAVE